MRLLLFSILCATADGHALPSRASEEVPLQYSGRLSDLRQDSGLLGEGWKGRAGLVIDDLSDTSSLRGPEQKVAHELVKLLRPKRIRACADFTYLREDNYAPHAKYRPGIVTLRIFIFERPADARAWWKEKYEHPGAEKHYRPVAGVGDLAVDSTEMAKRMVLIGNCWLTCHQLHQGSEYLQVLERYVEKLQRAAQRDHSGPP